MVKITMNAFLFAYKVLVTLFVIAIFLAVFH